MDQNSSPDDLPDNENKVQSSGVSVNDISVAAGGLTLLENAGADFPVGKLSLLVGPSGVGKSILLRIIAGLLPPNGEDIRWSGNVDVGGGPATAGKAGVVFQSFALFDELSPLSNIEFARSCAAAEANPAKPAELLQQLRVPSGVPTSRLSGGQRQRLAIARTLANNPRIILYDEPTSGLDPETGRQVAKLIRDTHDRYQKTSIVVTHDYISLLPIADRVVLIDSEKGTLVDLPKNDWKEFQKSWNL